MWFMRALLSDESEFQQCLEIKKCQKNGYIILHVQMGKRDVKWEHLNK